MMAAENKQSFWNHLDVLRAAIVKITLVTVGFGVVAFFFKEQLFSVVLAPKSDGFITYRLFNRIAAWGGGLSEPFSVQLINTGLAQQFVIHMKTALCAGVLCASPYILYQLFRFVSPALYENERRYVTRVVGGGYVMFGLGVLTSYFLIFPLTFRFLGTYQVSGDVDNLITLDSYISTLVMTCLAMGLVFEIPMLSWLFAKLGFSFGRLYAPLPETCRYNHSRCGGNHYPDFGCFYSVACRSADVDTLRGKYMDSKAI